MRLLPSQSQLLKKQITDELGDDCEILLFGSRVNDDARGGDVDLLVRSPRPISRKVWLAAHLAARAERLLGGRRVDVLLLDSQTTLEPVHAEALARGVPL